MSVVHAAPGNRIPVCGSAAVKIGGGGVDVCGLC